MKTFRLSISLSYLSIAGLLLVAGAGSGCTPDGDANNNTNTNDNVTGSINALVAQNEEFTLEPEKPLSKNSKKQCKLELD